MDRADVKANRQALRRVSDHLARAHERLGAQRESLGLVDVVYQPQDGQPALNYVSPRRGTAWIPGPQIEQGLDRLHELERLPRLQYIEGLFPEQFGQSLVAHGLSRAEHLPLLIAEPSAVASVVNAEDEARIVNDGRGRALWWYAQDNPLYAAKMRGVEPLDLRLDTGHADGWQVVDGVGYRRGFPASLARLTCIEGTAHIAGLAYLRADDPTLALPPLLALLAAASHERGDTLMFACAGDDQTRAALVNCGFTEAGVIVSYTRATK